METKASEFANARENGVYIFGAKRLGEIVFRGLEALDFKVWGFVDNDKRLWGEEIEGLTVYDPSVLREAKATVCIASTVYTHTLINQAKRSGSGNLISILIFAYFQSVGFQQRYLTGIFFEDFSEKCTRYLELYALLADDKSRRVLTGLLKYRLTYEPCYAAEVSDPSETQYFDKQLVKYGADEVFIDIGAYDGDTAQSYHEFSGGITKISFCLNQIRHCWLKQKGEIFQMNELNLSPLVLIPTMAKLVEATGVSDGMISPSGSQKVTVVSLDSLDDLSATFIKMDIEGAEAEAINGLKM